MMLIYVMNYFKCDTKLHNPRYIIRVISGSCLMWVENCVHRFLSKT